MKTEVRKEHGDWIVFVDDNPQFGLVYKEEAEKVRNMVDIMIDFKLRMEVTNAKNDLRTDDLYREIIEALKDIGAI